MSFFDFLAAAFGPKSIANPAVEPTQVATMTPVSAPAVEQPTPQMSKVDEKPAVSGPMAPPTAIAANPDIHGVGIRVDHLVKMGASQANALKYCGYLNEACERFKINNFARICAFICQTFEESGNLSTVDENLHYNAVTMNRVWPKISLAEAQQVCAGGPQVVAERVYGGRMGNVNPGDGYKYRGRGFIQLTGHDNYAATSKALGVDFVGNPELIKEPEYCALSAAQYWHDAGCNEMSDPDNIDAVTHVTKKINGAWTNIDLRLANWRKAEQVFADLK